MGSFIITVFSWLLLIAQVFTNRVFVEIKHAYLLL